MGSKRFDRLCGRLLVSNFVMVSDEAFALWTYENQEERWKTMHDKNLKKLSMEAKYTDGGGGKKVKRRGRSRKGRGWSAAGISCFNELCKIVQDDRNTERGLKMEEEFYNDKQHEQKKTTGSLKQTYEGDNEEVEEVFNEMEKSVVLGAPSRDVDFWETQDQEKGEHVEQFVQEESETPVYEV